MKGWKTVIFNVLAAILPVLQASGADLGLTGNKLAYYTLGVTIANLILRTITTTPIGTSSTGANSPQLEKEKTP